MILIIQSLWNESLTSKLVKSAEDYLRPKKIPFEVIQVPGALEIPLAVKWAWVKSQREQSALTGIIACGVIVKGDTYHFEIVANESARALMQLSVEIRLPIGNAVLAVYNSEQAMLRVHTKGAEAAEAVCQMSDLRQKMNY